MVKIPTFNNELQQTSESGNINLSISANPGALSAGDAAGAQIGNAIQQAGAVVGQFAKKEKEMRDAIEASEILQKVSTITTELETVSLGKNLLERDNYHKTNLNNLRTSILNGGDFSYTYYDNTTKKDATRNYAGTEGFKAPSNKAVYRLVQANILDSFATSTKGVHKTVTDQTIENIKFQFDKNNNQQVNKMLQAIKNNDSAGLYQTTLEQFGIDTDPNSPTYYLTLLNQGIDPKIGVSQYEHIAATGAYSSAAAAELEIKDWQDFLKREIDLRESEFVGLAFDEVKPAYDMLMQDLRANPKYNNLEYGLSPDAISKRIEELDDASAREVTRALSLESKIATTEKKFIKDSQDAMEQKVHQDIVAGPGVAEEEITPEYIERLLTVGEEFTDQYGKKRIVKIRDDQADQLLQRLKGQYEVDDFKLKRSIMTKIGEATSIVDILNIQEDFRSSRSQLKSESQQQIDNAIQIAINNNAEYNLYANNKDQLEASIGYTEDYTVGVSLEDLTVQQATLDYYDRLIWSGKYDMNPEVARAQAQNYYRKNVTQKWRKFGLTLPGFVLEKLGTDPTKWTSETVGKAREAIAKRVNENSFPLGALVFADEKLKSIQVQSGWNENVNQKDNKEIGKGDSKLNFEELAAKANIDATQQFVETDEGKNISKIKGIK